MPFSKIFHNCIKQHVFGLCLVLTDSILQVAFAYILRVEDDSTFMNTLAKHLSSTNHTALTDLWHIPGSKKGATL